MRTQRLTLRHDVEQVQIILVPVCKMIRNDGFSGLIEPFQKLHVVEKGDFYPLGSRGGINNVFLV